MPPDTAFPDTVRPVHVLPHRVRLASPSLKHAPRRMARIQHRLAGLPGLEAIRTNHRTGSILVTGVVTGLGTGMRPLDADWLAAEIQRALDPKSALAEENSSAPLWHLCAPETVLDRLESGARGLSAEDSRARLLRYGENRLPTIGPRSRWAILKGQFTNLPFLLLAGSAVVSLATGGLGDAAVIMGVVIINGLLGYRTEAQAERIIGSLTRDRSGRACVRRPDGATHLIPVETLVPGDVMVLAPGQTVPADGRVIEANNFSVDESALTGESLPVAKQVQALAESSLALGDRLNMVYKGTLCTGGQAVCVVVATGRETEIGHIQTIIGEARPPQTPLQRHLDQLGRAVVWGCFGVCASVFVIGVARGRPGLEMLRSAIALAVAAVPEGLPTIATSTLAMGIRDLKRRRILVRRLGAVETLGAVGVVCFDKTGTLTENRMEVAEMRAGGRVFDLSDGKVTVDGAKDVGDYPEIHRLWEVAALCNEAALGAGGEGSSTEASLLRAAGHAGLDVASLRQARPRLAVSYRDETRLYMVSTHDLGGGKVLVAVKGSPGQVLNLCTARLVDGETKTLNQRDRQALMAENHDMAGEALRVLGLAFAEKPDGGSDPAELAEDGLIWLGLVGLRDPVRNGIHILVDTFQRAGIDTVMLTGDQRVTARAIAEDLDLGAGHPIHVIKAGDLDEAAPEDWADMVRRAQVFARVSPSHKLKIVQAYQKAGRVVGMTGDGINDGPALRAADIGIAMGARGTDVARDLSDVVLETDDLLAMEGAVRRGRATYANIRKAIGYMISTNLSEVLVMFGATALGLGQPLNPMQLLWINVLTDVLPGLGLSMEPPEADIMNRPPRDPKAPMFDRASYGRMISQAAVMGGTSLGLYGLAGARGLGARPASTHAATHASTMAATSLIVSQLLHAQSLRSRNAWILGNSDLPPNPALRWAVGGALGAHGLALAVPPLRRLLGLAPLSPIALGVSVAVGCLPVVINEARKGRPIEVPR